MFSWRGRDIVLSGVAIGKEPLILKIISTHASGSNPNETYCIIQKSMEIKRHKLGKSVLAGMREGQEKNEIHYYIKLIYANF